MGKIIQFESETQGYDYFSKDVLDSLHIDQDAKLEVEDAQGNVFKITGAYFDTDKNIVTIYI